MSAVAANRVSVIMNHLSSSASHPAGLLAGQVAIITGAGQGIGGATALLFAKEGASVVVSDLDDNKGKDIANQIIQAGGKAIVVSGDVTDLSFPERLIEETVKAFGKINIIVNNAGFTFDGMLHKTTDKQYQLMLEVHNAAPFRIIRAAAKYMRVKDGESRSIVNVRKIRQLTMVRSCLTRAKENGETMVVDGQKISLGIPMGAKKEAPPPSVVFADTPLKRAGQVEEAAGSILLLCSPFASYVTGHTLEVTGGKGI
ncbi:Methionine aminopeptidase 1 [Mortierella sp. GBA35]|nr:Methionine aminopeptidase 1 [Mortierella sp. GBA35]